MMIEILKNSAMVQGLLEKYRAYSQRDRRIVLGLGASCFAAVLVFGLLLPVASYNDTAQVNYRARLDTYQFMQQNKGVFDTGKEGASVRDTNQSLLGLANTSSKAFGFVFKRYEPVGDNGLGLWLEDVSFNRVVLWLQRLDSQYNIHVTEIVVDQQSRAGMVNVRLELQG